MPRPKKQIFDPLIQAMIDRLPKPGDAFPRVERERWLALMKANMDLVYGSTGDEPTMADLLERHGGANFAERTVTRLPRHGDGDTTPVAKPFKPNKVPDFYVDETGVCLNKKGDRIMPEDIKGKDARLVDLRGPDGNIDIIVWADDSTGLQGDVLVTLE